jgi:hypothetical protein
MRAVNDHSASYPDRGALIGEVYGLLKAARAPLSKEWDPFGLDLNGWRRLHRLARKLSEHLYFEHRSRSALGDELRAAVGRYRARLQDIPRPSAKGFAAGVLDELAQPPRDWLAYLGVRHLDLPLGTAVGDVRFLHIDEEEGLAGAFSHFHERAPKLVCRVRVVAGTEDLALARARRAADSALALIRQRVLYGFGAKIYLDQVAFGLDGTFAWKIDDGFARTGWWAQQHPMETDLTADPEWGEALAESSNRREALSDKLRGRVDTALDWLDVAATTENWRIMLPAVFSAMEALLVPEDTGRKAGAVTVRSVAVHVALDEPFFNPTEIVAAYLWRNALVHGVPTHNLNETELAALAENRRMWAFRVFSDYLRLATRGGFESVDALVSHLDSEQGDRVCGWLIEHGGGHIVAEFRKVSTPRETR